MAPATEEIIVEGAGLHTGQPCRVLLRRTDGPVRLCSIGAAARIDELIVVSTARATTVGIRGGGLRVATVEHAFAALAGMGLYHGLTLEIEGPELPLLDGSASAWCAALSRLELSPSSPRLRVTRTAAFDVGPSRYQFAPAEDEIDVTARIDFGDPRLAPEASWQGDAADFVTRIAPARTFALVSDLDELARRGLARRVQPEQVVIIAPDTILHAGLPFSADEPARHKLLDLLGDLYLAGGPPRGRVFAERPGHAANARVFQRALEDGVLAMD